MWFSSREVSQVLSLGLSFAASVQAAPAEHKYAGRTYNTSQVLVRDVLVIGGGSSGTYGAMKLMDAGKSVLVVEKEAIMGGHTNTYTDPTTNATIDYGVVVFHNNSLTKKYFERFNVPLIAGAAVNLPTNTIPVDFTTGVAVTDFVPQNSALALPGYLAQLLQYPYVETGFDLPDPVPEDLLLPFGDFLKKWKLEDMSRLTFSFAQGLGNFLDQPTLYVFKNLGSEIVEALATDTGFLTTAHQDNSEIYRKATAELLAANSLFLSSQILSMTRKDNGVQALVSTPTGTKLVLADKVLLSIPPKTSLLSGFDLSINETELFNQFNNSAYYTGLITNTGIPDNTALIFASSTDEYNIPRLPGTYAIIPSTRLPDLFDVKYGSPYEIPERTVKTDILNQITALGTAGTIPTAGKQGDVDFVAFNSHVPFELTVSTEAIKNGFYKELYALQGLRSTWWTGAAWHAHDSSMLWQFTDTLVDRMLKTF